MDDLVFDRTEQKKGKLHTALLNRIEDWTGYLAGRLRAQGYETEIAPYRRHGGSEAEAADRWTKEDIPTRPEIDRIRVNVEALQEGFYSLPDWREIVYNNTMDYNQANALEWDLQTIYDWLGRMVSTLDAGWAFGIAHTGLYAKEGYDAG